jgi:RES domain-containing protein
MKQHPEATRLRRSLGQCAKYAVPWSGVVYRSASVAYANRDDLLTGVGAKREGARWNPPDSLATVYTSLEMRTATEEALAYHRYFGFPVEMALPRILVAIRVSLQHVLNLTDQPPRKVLGINRSRLIGEDWRARNASESEALTQAIGCLAWEDRWEGLLVPSLADAGGVNLIVFPGNMVPPGSYLLIINRDQLPPLAMSIT